ncbi:hypothetical protein ACQ4PT_069827 [Festuca glaucescens]
MVGWFVTPNIAELMRIARECAADRYKLLRGSKEKLGKLAQDLEDIKRLLDQASTTFVNDQARLADLWQLKDYVHDAEEVLDQFVLEIKATNGLINGMKYNKVSSSLSKQLVKVLKNLGETRQRARDLQHHQPSQSSVLRKAETGHLPVRDGSSFLGYDKEYMKLKALPALGGLPCLELLDIKELTVVERIGRGLCGSSGPRSFGNLKKIVLDDMPELVAWDDMPKGAFPRLSDISIIDYRKLSSLSGLEWFSCDQLRVKGCPAITAETLRATFSAHASTCKFY